MFLRYFVTADESPAGQLALAYLPALLRIAPVRVIDPRRLVIGVLDGPWAKYSTLLGTPMTGPMINVVCTSPDRWTWVQKVTATKKDDLSSEKETVTGRCELYTAGVRNVLISSTPFGSISDDQQDTAIKYEAAIAPEQTVFSSWADSNAVAVAQARAGVTGPVWGNNLTTVMIIPIPVTDHAALRRTILGVP